MMPAAVVPFPERALVPELWRDPHTVPPEERVACIQKLEAACMEAPHSAGLRTLLGVAYAVNYEVYKSMDALEAACGLDPDHFFAQLKLAELWYRLRALPKAEQETLRALQLAGSHAEMHLARRQLQEIRKLMNNSMARPTWGKSLVPGAVFLALLTVIGIGVSLWQ